MASYRFDMLLVTGAAVVLCAIPVRAQSTLTTKQARPAPPARVPPANPPPTILRINPVARGAMSPENRIALLEEELQRAEQRIAALEVRLNTHTHTFQYTVVGLLREPLNGRPVDLAISPRSMTGTTSPPR